MTKLIRRASIAAALLAIPAGAAMLAPSAFAVTADAPTTITRTVSDASRAIAAAGADGRLSAVTATPTTIEAAIITLTNKQRTANGCKAVKTDGRLTYAARAHSKDMAANKYFSHTGLDGSNFVTRAKEAGYPRPSAENIAWGYRTADAVMKGWMNSSGHRKNILTCSHTTVGVGMAKKADGTPYYTQVFGR